MRGWLSLTTQSGLATIVANPDCLFSDPTASNASAGDVASGTSMGETPVALASNDDVPT